MNLWEIRWFEDARSRRARVHYPESTVGMTLHVEHSSHLVQRWVASLLVNDVGLTWDDIPLTGYVVCARCLYRELSLTSDAWHVP